MHRKSHSRLLDAADREYYSKQLAARDPQHTVTGSSSLLSALDEDYGVQSANCVGKVGLTKEVNDYNGSNHKDELVQNEHTSNDDEDVIPNTPPSAEKSSKRKPLMNKKQRKITDIYPKLK